MNNTQTEKFFTMLKKYYLQVNWEEILQKVKFTTEQLMEITRMCQEMWLSGKEIKSICRYQNPSKEYVEEFSHLMDWKTLSKYKNFSKEEIEDFFSMISLKDILGNKNISKNLKMYVIDLFLKEKDMEHTEIKDKDFILSISKGIILPSDFIEYIFKNVSFRSFSDEERSRLIKEQNIPEKTLVEFKDIADYEAIFKYHNCGSIFIVTHFELFYKRLQKVTEETEWSPNIVFIPLALIKTDDFIFSVRKYPDKEIYVLEKRTEKKVINKEKYEDFKRTIERNEDISEEVRQKILAIITDLKDKASMRKQEIADFLSYLPNKGKKEFPVFYKYWNYEQEYTIKKF